MDVRKYYAALILLCTLPKGVSAINILTGCDAIDHGGPSADEFYEGLNFLYANGLVVRHGKRFRRTESGEQLIREEQDGSAFEICKAIANRFSAMPQVEPSTEIISMKEAKIAANRYGRFGCFFILWPF